MVELSLLDSSRKITFIREKISQIFNTPYIYLFLMKKISGCDQTRPPEAPRFTAIRLEVVYADSACTWDYFHQLHPYGPRRCLMKGLKAKAGRGRELSIHRTAATASAGNLWPRAIGTEFRHSQRRAQKFRNRTSMTNQHYFFKKKEQINKSVNCRSTVHNRFEAYPKSSMSYATTAMFNY